jgi:acetyltransferase-like isoleucine patch superfamily enzyme
MKLNSIFLFFCNTITKIKNTLLNLVESSLRNISGGIGQKLRFMYYKHRFKSCGKGVKIDSHVFIYNPENISIGDDVWIMPFTILHGGNKHKLNGNRVLLKNNKHLICHDETLLVIGSQVSIGSHSIIHGYGGLEIEDKVTISARVSIYSFSHYPFNPLRKTEVTYANSMIKTDPIVCIQSPIKISSGVWLGLGVTVYGGNIGKNSFVTTNSIVINGVPENCIASGHPANKIKVRFEL